MILSPAILKSPYIKGKNFMDKLCPIIKYGIPKYADSVRDPKVVGTPAWTEFWEEELYKIINGISAGGLFIPGRFYYYMNYKRMSTIKGVISPDMVDLHLELCYYIEYCKANGHNLLCAKGRRKGISEAAATMVIDYGFRFTEGYKAGVAAGSKTYVDDFLSKWRFADTGLPPELSIKKLVDNDDEIVAGYSIKNSLGAYEEQGTKNTIYARTMHVNPNMFKGLYLNDLEAEEVGEFEKFLEFYSASKDCLMSGNKQVGMLMAFGTGGNINKGSKDFKKVWHEAANFNMIKFLIPATRFYFYGGATAKERQLPADSDLFKKYKPYELIGCEDMVLSEKFIKDGRDKFLKQGNLKAYNEDLQNNPLNETEIFRKTVVNNFDIERLNNQQAAIDALEYPKYSKFKLEWVKDDKGMIKMPLQVNAIPLNPREDSDECLWMLDSERPRKGYSNLYVAGLDGYDQDTAKASKSLGAMCIMIRENYINNAVKMAPVAVISCRPKRKEKFYELCLMASVYYNLIDNVLVDVGAGLVIQYFKDNGGAKFLADRPKKFESETSEQTHEKGVRLTNFSRPRMVGLMQAHIVDKCNEIWFPELINQLGNYDEVEIGSDNDLADAYGLALMQDISCDVRPRDSGDFKKDDTFDLPDFVMDREGNLMMRGERPELESDEQDHAMFGS
jgi:hypothetical protein